MAIRLLFQRAPEIPCGFVLQYGIMIIETAKGRDMGDKRGLLTLNGDCEGLSGRLQCNIFLWHLWGRGGSVQAGVAFIVGTMPQSFKKGNYRPPGAITWLAYVSWRSQRATNISQFSFMLSCCRRDQCPFTKNGTCKSEMEQKSPKELVAEVETGQVSLGNQHKTHLLPALTLCKYLWEQ